ncbi:glycosyltransferase [Haliscomenobacter sp.]|uniref:glycosyltransferase n=1 Tax=Haliscomenobacter sp. TaxID=2717303 RepID=UPI0035942DC2
MRVINIIDRADQVNFGIWNAAIFTAACLEDSYNISSEVWLPPGAPSLPEGRYFQYEIPSVSLSAIPSVLNERNLNSKTDIIVTHGCWQYPTIWGNQLSKQGYIWIVLPQGMLEPWSMQQKKWKKFIYFHLREKIMLHRATIIRAVGRPERDNLRRLFPEQQVMLIPNGVDLIEAVEKPRGKFSVLFLSRLHHKKGVILLVQAWVKSLLNNQPNYELVIAGPDEGEQEKILAVLNQSTNIRLLGPVYGAEKEELLKRCHFFALPSFSEGFPTAVLEGINYGLKPLISKNCNFPELSEAGHAVALEPDVHQIIYTLNQLTHFNFDDLEKQAIQARLFLSQHYTTPVIAANQHELYQQLIDEHISRAQAVAAMRY